MRRARAGRALGTRSIRVAGVRSSTKQSTTHIGFGKTNKGKHRQDADQESDHDSDDESQEEIHGVLPAGRCRNLFGRGAGSPYLQERIQLASLMPIVLRTKRTRQ